ncbi:Es2 [Carabus blaptoides fortunei]
MNSSCENSPGNRALIAMKDLEKDIVFKTPTVPRKKLKKKVLDEDAYIEGMEKIIQRDYFPDLEKLKAQNEYLDAVEKNDVIKIREMHLRYTGRRPPTERLASPATFETPLIHNISHTPQNEPPKKEPELPVKEKTVNINLDQYLSVHTSEDNESFNEIMLEADRKHRQKYSYLYNEEAKSDMEQQQMLMLPSIERQCALPEKKLNIDTWGYKNRNYIMYIPDGVELTKEQIIEMNKKKQETVYNNTRLSENPFNEQQSKETITELAKTQAKVKDGKIGVDGKELVTESPQIRGYGFVRTPSPCPAAMDSPLMTWGEIEGTPFMLDGSDTPLPRTPGPAFKMADPPRRERLALALAEKAGERHRDRKQKAIQAARKQFATPSPRPNTSIERLESMSPAARRLATSRLGISNATDLGLRASYSPSPKSRPRTPLTPRKPSTPRIGGKITLGNNLTDNLLNISLPKRQKAADFF